MHYFINIARNKLKFVCLKLHLTHVFNFKWRRWQPCRWLSGTNKCVKAHVGDVIIVWRNTHDNTEPNAIWFPAKLTDTDLNIQGIQVKYRTNGNCNIPATENRLWGTKWYHLFSAQVRMLRRGAFGIFHTTIFNWTIKNCVSSRGSSKGYPFTWQPHNYKDAHYQQCQEWRLWNSSHSRAINCECHTYIMMLSGYNVFLITSINLVLLVQQQKKFIIHVDCYKPDIIWIYF